MDQLKGDFSITCRIDVNVNMVGTTASLSFQSFDCEKSQDFSALSILTDAPYVRLKSSLLPRFTHLTPCFENTIVIDPANMKRPHIVF
jgi:hypothetical protein